ncbi:MAG: T9SS type A sorting domain-containing protein, partial [Candidatus Margulisbacteria bacterium]|nr:T9SS type A sorting domain-containing protein [Candidatus Margulisiibacteriota bacterium]
SLSRELTKTFTANEVASVRPNLLYTIHEFDEGLERSTSDTDFVSWKVIAYDENDVATAESSSAQFLIMPDLTISGITNYPNPFNPNNSTTKIRYRLSTTADDVKIRIYDITGRLVKELVGTTNAEGSSVWDKYNDVDWDGRNGAGDIVVNGIYPFEVRATLSGTTVSGRGKVAVLK